MGTVEVALERGDEGAERIVALKRLLPEGARDPRHKEMFLREARLAALLTHPNVVHAFAFGELYGDLFMAMEYVEGEPLSRVLRAVQEEDRGLAATAIAHILAEVCEGLHAAHELRDKGAIGQPLNVVHRDISPHNVMIAYDGQVKLLDFGVAKFEGVQNTRTGEIKGKMAYMSPEQALGEKLDRRSDLFSIGAVLFECLAGRRMWGSGTDLDVMRRLALESPPRLDHVVANAPLALVDLYARLMARDPAKRPATARHVAEELRAFAAASEPAGDAEAVRRSMQDLFGHQAEGRRALLTDSLQDVAPSRVERLQHGLAREPAIDYPTSAEALFVRSSIAPPRRAPRRFGTAVLFFALTAATIATAMAVRRGPTAQSAAPPTRAKSPPAMLDPAPHGTVATAEARAAPPPAVQRGAETLPAPQCSRCRERWRRARRLRGRRL